MMLRRNKLLPAALLAAGGNKNSSRESLEHFYLTFKVVTRPEGCQKGSVLPPVSGSTLLRPFWSKGPRLTDQ